MPVNAMDYSRAMEIVLESSHDGCLTVFIRLFLTLTILFKSYFCTYFYLVLYLVIFFQYLITIRVA